MCKITRIAGPTTKKWTSAIAAIIILASLASCPLRGETVEDEKGFFLGLKIIGSSLHDDNSDGDDFYVKEDGGGLHLDFGYRFNPVFMLELSVGGATHDTSDPAISARSEVVQIMAHYRFSPERAFRPYIKGGFGGYALYLEENPLSWRAEGGGIALGGGFRYFFSSYFSLGLDITHNIIRYDKAKLAFEGFSYETEIDEDGSMTSFGITFGYSF